MIWWVSWRCQRLIFSGSSNTDSCIRLLTEWQNNPMDVPCTKHKGKHFHATCIFCTQPHSASSLSNCFFAPTPSILLRNPEMCLLFFLLQALKGFSCKSYMTCLSRTLLHCSLVYMKLQTQYKCRKAPLKPFLISSKCIYSQLWKDEVEF